MFPPFFMLPLGFIIFPYIVNLINNASYKNSLFNLFVYGLFFGIGFFFIFLFWIYNPFLVFEATRPFAFLSLLLPLFLSIFFGLSFLIYKFIKDIPYIILFTVFIFLISELVISNFLYGFPWFSFSLILSNNFLGFYFIKYYGTLTSGFFTLSIFVLPSFLFYFREFNKKNILILFAYLPLFFFILIPIKYYFFNNEKSNGNVNLDIYQILSPIDKPNKNQIEQNIIQLINSSDADYIIFAENNYPHIIYDSNFFDIIKSIKNKKKVIFGATREEDDKFYNSFILLEDGKIQYFDKKILVPFGEFLPLRKFLKFMEKISGTIDYESGNIDRLLTTKEGINIFPIICYEIIFDHIFKNINKYEIDILINITNDSWFGKKIGPYQHFYLSRLKSLIANKPIVRVSNNGISAIIDQNGKIIKSSNLNEFRNLKYNLKIKSNFSYYLIHNLFVYYLIFLFFFFLLFNKHFINGKK
jgi:apolipoprotein N-acyltransferase